MYDKQCRCPVCLTRRLVAAIRDSVGDSFRHIERARIMPARLTWRTAPPPSVEQAAEDTATEAGMMH